MMVETEFLWTIVAFAYCFAAVYLKAFDTYKHPAKVWGAFLLVGSSLFIFVNIGRVIPTSAAHVVEVLEYGVIIAVAVSGAVLFTLAIEYGRAAARERELRGRLLEYENYPDDRTKENDND